jgi:cell division septum initiation protein DivIVA
MFSRSDDKTPQEGREAQGGNSAPLSPSASSGSELKRVVDAAAHRVDEIVDGAEQVAAEIIAEAENEAAQYLDGRRHEVEQVIDRWSSDLKGVAELLSRQEDRLRELTEAMIGELDEIATVLRRIPPEIDRWREQSPVSTSSGRASRTVPGQRLPPGASAPQASKPQPRQSPTEGPAAADPAPPSGSRPQGREKALLRAAQMAVAGGSRDEIERALMTELSIRDPAPIVDELLGPRA